MDDPNTMNELQRALGRIEGNQESFYSEWKSYRDTQGVRIDEVEKEVRHLSKFKNFASGATALAITALSVITGMHISRHP